TNRVSIPGRWLGMAHDRLKPGPAVTGALIALLAIVPNVRSLGPAHPGPFSVYYTAGDWLAANARPEEKILDLTEWSLFFSRREGYRFADVYTAPADPQMRWVIVQKPDAEREWHYSRIVRDLVRGREAVARVPATPVPGETQVCIYDCQAPVPLAASGGFNLRDQEPQRPE